MNLFSKAFGAIEGIAAGWKFKGVDISAAVNDAKEKTAVPINIIKNYNDGKLPNIVLIDAFLIGYIYQISSLVLAQNGITIEKLLSKATLHVSATCLEMKEDDLIRLISNMDSKEIRNFHNGASEAKTCFGKLNSGDQSAFLPIMRHIKVAYDIFK